MDVTASAEPQRATDHHRKHDHVAERDDEKYQWRWPGGLAELGGHDTGRGAQHQHHGRQHGTKDAEPTMQVGTPGSDQPRLHQKQQEP